jgi:hypothetical protein
MTMVRKGVGMEQLISKSSFKAKALEYFRQVESTGKEWSSPITASRS